MTGRRERDQWSKQLPAGEEGVPGRAMLPSDGRMIRGDRKKTDPAVAGPVDGVETGPADYLKVMNIAEVQTLVSSTCRARYLVWPRWCAAVNVWCMPRHVPRLRLW